MRPRRPSPATLLDRIRRQDLTACSDDDLRQAVRDLRARSEREAPESLLPDCFAVVVEAIDRRLGLWRLFDGTTAAPYLDAGTDPMTATVAEMARQRRHRPSGDVLLPADFYRRTRDLEESGGLRFLATDAQLLAAIHMSRGNVVQMDAGEGKTVAIALAAAFHAAVGRRVHLITANDYLARRDSDLLEPVYRSLGLRSGAVMAHTEEAERRRIYSRDIVYGSMRELGFDHLRDHLKTDREAQVQRPLDIAVVDEADHALIDEAFTPMIISGNPLGGSRMAVRVNAAVANLIERQRALAGVLGESIDATGSRAVGLLPRLATLALADPENESLKGHLASRPSHRRRVWALAEDDHSALSGELYYAVHPGNRYVTLTDRGRDFLESSLGPVFGGPEPSGSEPSSGTFSRRQLRRQGLANQVSQALRAHLLLSRDVDYIVDDDGIVLVDPHTGRPKPDSIYQHGLQTAVEAREGVTVRPENETLAQISVSGYMGLYRQVAGITGTASTATGEFRRKYGLPVVAVPPVNPGMRVAGEPVVYLDRESKLAAVVDQVAARHRTGQPVLVATGTVEQSAEMSGLLEERDIPHRVLNAVTTHAEAGIVRDAGAFGAVTVATPMAGRGTDILLEPDLDVRVARQTVEEARRLLSEGPEGVEAVDVDCPSPEQAEVLAAELARRGEHAVSRAHGSASLRITLPEASGHADGGARLEFGLGLCVIGTEVHDSSRISLQLSGRSGRQGQFGMTRTILSLEDRLVNLDAEAFLKLPGSRREDAAGRPYYAGPEVSRRVRRLQEAADHEGESQRGLMQDYSAELDRQTSLYHEQRRGLMDMAADPGRMVELCRETTERVAAHLVRRHFGVSVDDYYPRRFAEMREEVARAFAVDCSSLYGADFALLPQDLASLLLERLEEQAARAAPGAFPELARRLLLQVCGELWPRHLASLRDLLAIGLLSGRNHKTAVADYIRRCVEGWHGFRQAVDEEFASRLSTLPALGQEEPTSPVAVTGETRRLLFPRP